MRVFLVSLSALWLALAPATGFAQNVQVTSTFDKRTAQVNEEIQLTIRVSGAEGNIQAPRLPAFQAFDTFYTGRASHLTFINGQSSSTVEFTYLLVPKAAGHFTLAPIEVQVGSSLFRTSPIDIEILGNQGQLQRSSPPPASASSSPSSPPPAAASGPVSPPIQPPAVNQAGQDDNIFVQAWVDKNTAYPNEQVLLTYSLYTRYDTRYEGFEEEPAVSGFWIEEFPMERDIPKETVIVNGKRYIKADIRQIALFPTAPAQYTIQPGKIRVSIRQQPQQTSVFDDFFDDSFFTSGSFFARRENRLLAPPPIQVNVKPLPEEGKPAGFQGAVGNFNMSATLKEQKVRQNEPVTMTLVLEGEGNVETLEKPVIPNMPDFKTYEADTSTQLFKRGTVIGGRKTFEIVFIPRKAGSQVIPSLEFSFFNPSTGKYQVLKTPEFPIQVEKGEDLPDLPANLSRQDVFKRDFKLEGQDVRYIWERVPSGKRETAAKGILFFLIAADILLTLLLGAGFLRAQAESLAARDPAGSRRRRAALQVRTRLKKLRAKARSSQPEAMKGYFEELDKAMTQYLADKFNLSAYGVTRMDIERQLQDALGAEDPLYQEIMELYRICDESRFGGAQYAAEHKQQALKILVNAVNRMEKVCR